jgi:hypothetical protein
MQLRELQGALHDAQGVESSISGLDAALRRHGYTYKKALVAKERDRPHVRKACEDECRTRKDHSARNLAMIRRAVLNLLRHEPSPISLKRKRLKAWINPAFRQAILAC